MFSALRSVCGRIIPMGLVAFGLMACNNYTVQPLCTDNNAVVPAGITGVYSMSLQDDDFNVQTTEYEVMFNANGRLAKVAANGDAEESRICQVGAYTINESFDATVGAYEQQRLYVTNMGLTFLPQFYDRTALDALAVPYKIFDMPEDARSFLGAKISNFVESVVTRVALALDEEANKGLLIDNTKVSDATLSSASHAGPVGYTLLRK